MNSEVPRLIKAADGTKPTLPAEETDCRFKELEALQKRLERLSKAVSEIISNLGKISRHSILTLIAKHATEILAAEVGCVLLLRDEETLSLEAGYGHREDNYLPGKQFKIISGDKTGLTGHIAYEGKLFNAHGTELIDHPAVRSTESTHTHSGRCYSLLAIPLRTKDEKLVGLLRVDNKKGEDNLPHPAHFFTKEDELVLGSFAELVVVCLESAVLVEELSIRREMQQRLINNLPHAVIAVDLMGKITEFNEQAERILGYRKDEVINTQVDRLYYDPFEPRRIGKLLHQSREGKVVDVETGLRNSLNQQLPIRLTASWLVDEKGRRTGSVGYFEDIRLLKKYERRLKLILRTINAVAHAEDLYSGLQSLADMLVDLFPNAFCCIMLLDESETSLVLEAAAFPDDDAQMEEKWARRVGTMIALADYSPLSRAIDSDRPATIKYSKTVERRELEDMRTRLGLDQAIESLLVIPLNLGNRTLGVLNLGEFCPESQSQFTEESIELASAIAAQSTVLIDRMRALKFAELGREKLLDFYRVSSELITQQDPGRLLDAIVRELFKAAGAASVHLVLIDEQGRAWNPISYAADQAQCVNLEVRPNGISMKVFLAGKAEVFPEVNKARERLNPNLWSETRAVVCLPLSLPHKRIGVMWIHYNHPRRFSEFEIVSLQLYVNQAAMAYENAQEMERMARLRDASESLSQEIETDKILDQILQTTRKTLEADYVIFWFFDSERDAFIQERSVSLGIEQEMWAKCQAIGPRRDGTAYKLMDRKWEYVNDIADPYEKQKLDPNILNLMTEIGARGFLGIPLRAGQEKLGVLYALYQQPCSFTENGRVAGSHLGRYASLALKKGKLIEQVRKTNAAVNAVADTTVLGDRRATLEAIVKEVGKAVDCDSVVLWEYDRDKRQLLPPTEIGVEKKEKYYSEEPLENDLIYKLLDETEPYLVDTLAENPDFKDRPFARDEQVVSCIALPLQATGQKVGVMFVNYRRRRRFTAEEVHTVRLFANQAALAIHYAQFTEKLQRIEAHLHAVHSSSKAITASSGRVQEVLDQIVREAVESVTSVNLPKAVIGTIDLFDDVRTELTLRSIYPIDYHDLLVPLGYKWSYRQAIASQNRIGVVGRAVGTKQSQLVRDVRADPDYIIRNKSTRSQLSVPLLYQAGILGAITVESDQFNGFDEYDRMALEALAEHAVIAIQNASQYEELRESKSRISSATALAWMGMVNNSWRHIIVGQAAEIANRATLVRELIKRKDFDGERISHHLDQIEQLVKSIQDKPITPPLSSEVGVCLVDINDLVTERLAQLRQHDRYYNVRLIARPSLDQQLTVLVSSEWLRRALDILVDNATDAVKNLEPARRKVMVSTELREENVAIIVADLGHGISEPIRQQLFKIRVEGSKGLGMGLLVATAILETYGGKIELSRSDERGTVMVIILPRRL